MRGQAADARDKHGSFSILVLRLNAILLESQMSATIPQFQWQGEWYGALCIRFCDPDIQITTDRMRNGEPVILRVFKNHTALGNIVMQIMMFDA